MARTNCDACNDLEVNAPEFTLNGVTDKVCTSLKNNTGLDASNGNDNCADLEDANDCLIGNMADEVEAYDVCDWKDYIRKFVPNVYNVLKAMICSMCGLWTNVTKLWCYVNNIVNPKTYQLHAYQDDDPAKPAINGFKIVDGVRMRAASDTKATPITFNVSGSGIAYFTGTLYFYGNMPVSYTNGKTVAWRSFFDGGTDITTYGDYTSKDGDTPNGGLLICQFEINPCDYGFKNFHPTPIFPYTGGDYQMTWVCIQPGQEYLYDYGFGKNGTTRTYSPSDTNKVLLQLRLERVRTWGIVGDNGRVTPRGVVKVTPCTTKWDC